MIWLISIKLDMSLEARLVVRGDLFQPDVDCNSEEIYCGNVTATSIKIFLTLCAKCGLIFRERDLVVSSNSRK